MTSVWGRREMPTHCRQGDVLGKEVKGAGKRDVLERTQLLGCDRHVLERSTAKVRVRMKIGGVGRGENEGGAEANRGGFGRAGLGKRPSAANAVDRKKAWKKEKRHTP